MSPQNKLRSCQPFFLASKFLKSMVSYTTIFQKQPLDVLSKKRCSSVPEAYNFIKKGFWHKCFPVNFAKFLRTSFLTEHTVAASETELLSATFLIKLIVLFDEKSRSSRLQMFFKSFAIFKEKRL